MIIVLGKGADGLIVKVHNCPEKALCDASRQLTPQNFAKMMVELRKAASAVGRKA